MNEVLYEFETEKKYIEEFQLESTTGTKKMMQNYHINAINSRNAYINNKIEEYESLKSEVYEEMQKRVQSLIPQDTDDNYREDKNKIKMFRKAYCLDNKYNDIYHKLDIDKVYYDISDIDVADFQKVNTLIQKIIETFKNASISLTADDFDYSMFTHEYMEVYFKSLNSVSFMDDMKKIFDNLYWECPDLITHLKLCIRNLYIKYEKELALYYEKCKSETFKELAVDETNYKEAYSDLIKALKSKTMQDPYLLSYKFLNGSLSIYDYLDGTPQIRQNFNKFLFDKEFDELEEKAKEDYYTEISALKDVVVELKNYNKYNEIIKDIITRYKSADSYKGVYGSKLKEIEKEEKNRTKLYTQYYKEPSKFILFNKKINKNLIKVQINDQIKKLDLLYNELDEAKINDVIMNKLDDTSTISEALAICSSFYGYFKKMCPKLEIEQTNMHYFKEYKKLLDYTINPRNSFITKMKCANDSNINDIIYEKYKLLDINISMEDLTENLDKLEANIDFVNLLKNINDSQISVEEIKYIIDFKKINKD